MKAAEVEGQTLGFAGYSHLSAFQDLSSPPSQPDDLNSPQARKSSSYKEGFMPIHEGWGGGGCLQFTRPLSPACSLGLCKTFWDPWDPQPLSPHSDSRESADGVDDRHSEAVAMLCDAAACALVFAGQRHRFSLWPGRHTPSHLCQVFQIQLLYQIVNDC